MKLCTFSYQNIDNVGIITDNRIVSVEEVNVRAGTKIPDTFRELIAADCLDELRAAEQETTAGIPLAEVRLKLPYPDPPKIWCIGLNYRSHADDIDAVQPEEPGSFMKPSSSLFDPGGIIELPPKRLTSDVDAEGELGLVFGKKCREVPVEEISEVLFGYTTTLDMTALDVLARNPRYLQRSKSFDTFFSFGPVIATVDEIDDVTKLEVVTRLNGDNWSRDFVYNMRHRPFFLASLHSDVMTFEPGDLLSTGCPRGARIKAGDRVEAYIEGVGRLTATVGVRKKEPWSHFAKR
jgi:2-keto-4-pentenoate hydratase/2-oxohepta-3-ene-1,7-dioic acid hydratase in catechol pathway